MNMDPPRLPSGVYFNLLASATANQAHYIPEYPEFSTSPRIVGGWEQSFRAIRAHDFAQPQKLAVPEPGLLQPPPPEVCLPLLSVAIDMQVDCNIAKTKVVQTFTNHGGVSIPEAWYSFPLYDGAAVTAFRCEVGDSKVLKGRIKPKDEAKRDFQRAVKKQEAAALVEEMAPDVFQTTIGNIKPRTTVKVEITYVEELHTDLSGEGIVVTIPTSVAPRYGTAPAGYMANSAVKETGLSLIAKIAYPGRGKDIVCRSGHNISFEYGNISHVPEASSFEALAELQNQEDSGLQTHHATVRLSNGQTAMDRDIILFIPFSDDILLNSRALLAPSSGSDHAAMMVTVRPSELFSDLRESMGEFEGEVLFLADRSGSMQGSKIAELKDALLVFLKSLPAKCRFNLYSFGGIVSSLWPRSMPYNDSSLQEALDHVSTFQADFGGTEVLAALSKAVDDRHPTDVSSTQLILLTDGEIWQPEQTIEFVRKTTLDAEGQLRFFSLGIGNQVSHPLIQGIGFFGGGFGEAVSADVHGKWKEAVIRMLKGALMPESWSCSIALGDQWKEKRLDVDNLSPQQSEISISGALGRLTAPADPSFVQAPRVIPMLHHFGQQSVHFLLESTNGQIPDHVTITACSQYGGVKTATLPVTKVTSKHTIQHLAAKAVVRDLENQDTTEAALMTQIRKNAENLCQKYCITSKWTSFVAVSHLQQSAEYDEVEVSQYKAPLAALDLLLPPGISQSCANFASSSEGQLEGGEGLESLYLTPSVEFSPWDEGLESLFLTPSFECSPWGECHSAPPPALHNTPRRVTESQSMPMDGSVIEGFQIPSADRAAKRRKSIYVSRPSRDTQSACGVDPEMFDQQNAGTCTIDWQEIVRCQRADGLFHLEETLEDCIGQHFCHGTQQVIRRSLMGCLKSCIADNRPQGETAIILVGTLMALSYIRSHFYSERALWDLLLQKAEGRVASLLNPGQLARQVELSAMADSALAHAHYGRCSQGSDESAWSKIGPGGGSCGVCNAKDKEELSFVMLNDVLTKCSFSGCNVCVGSWSDFWAHAVEQGHIHSSCETARRRYSEAAANVTKGNAGMNVQKTKRKMVHEEPDGQDGQNQSSTPKRKRIVAEVGC